MAAQSHSSTLRDASFERILLIKPSSLGDIIHALPVLHGLRGRYPSARIDWLVNAGLARLLEAHPALDEVIPFDRAQYARLWRSPTVALSFQQFLADLRRRRYDLVIDLQGLFRTGFLARATGARIRIGFRDARECAPVFYTHWIEVEDPNRHAVDKNYRVADMLGFRETPMEFNWGQTGADVTAARALLAGLGLPEECRWAAIVPGARWETKLWPLQRFAEVIDQLQTIDQIPCVLLGGPEEGLRCRQLSDLCQTQPYNLCGRTDVRGFATLIGLASTVLCLDSAAAHLAAAMRRPLVCIAGPTNPRRTGPYNRLRDVVWRDIECSPCYLRRLNQCPHQHRCLTELESGPVLAAVRQSLKSDISPIQLPEGSVRSPAVPVP